MQLRRLEIQSFRGIKERLEITIKSPLTIIYAPNGTGKTTICDAVEWLLTGAIYRLHGRESEDGTDIRCVLSDPTSETKVTGHFEVNGEAIIVERDLLKVRWKRAGKNFVKIADSKLLEAFAPSDDELGTFGRHTAASRRTWLRGNRFLSGENLSALLDSDSGSMENRQQLFSDLLGVGHLLETENLMKSYRQHLGPAIRQSAALAEAKAGEIEERRARGKAVSELNSETHKTIAADLINRARAELGLPPLDVLVAIETLRSDVLKLTATIEEKASSHRIRGAAIAALNELWPERETLFQSESRTIERLNEVAQQSGTVSSQQNKLQTDISRVESSIREGTLRISRVMDAASIFRAALNGVHQATIREAEGISLKALRERARDDLADDRGLKKVEITSLISGLAGHAANRSSLNALSTEISEAQAKLWSAEVGAKKILDIETARRDAADKKQIYEAVVGPIEQLKVLANSVVAHLSETDACPVCDHRWGSHEVLLTALSKTTAEASSDVIRLGVEATNAKKVYDAIIRDRSEQEQIAARLVALGNKLSAIEAMSKAFDARVTALSLNTNASDLDLQLRDRLSRCELGDALRQLDKALIEYEAALGSSLDKDAVIGELQALASIASDNYRGEAENALARLREQLNSTLAQRASLAAQLQLLSTEKSQLEGNRAVWAPKLSELHSAWKVIGGGDDFSDEVLRQITGKLGDESAVIAIAGEHLKQADSSIDNAVYSDEVANSQTALDILNADYGRLLSLDKTAASIEAAYRDARVAHVLKQFAGMVQVISVLFSRMQANEVYQQVVGGHIEQPLSWRAICNGLPVSPENKFSQGQRQDFALAIFLARARGLSGTFILDEPLAHLDDLNRVALLDAFRSVALEKSPGLSFILTTASWGVARHFSEKFSLLTSMDQSISSKAAPLLDVVELRGNPLTGVEVISSAIH